MYSFTDLLAACFIAAQSQSVDDLLKMVKEVADAVWWLSERCHEYGASSSRVSLVGHSAGAQLCFMAVLDLITRKGQSTEQTHFLPSQCIGEQAPLVSGHQMQNVGGLVMPCLSSSTLYKIAWLYSASSIVNYIGQGATK